MKNTAKNSAHNVGIMTTATKQTAATGIADAATTISAKTIPYTN